MKKWLRSSITLLLAVVMIVSSAAFVNAEADVDITDGLLAHYDFESAAGTTVVNNVTSNTTTTATLSGNASLAESDHLGKAMQLSGGGLQLMDIVNAADSSFSVSLWYKASASSGSNVNLVQAGTIGGSTGRTILILDPNSKYQTYVTGDNAKTPTSSAVNRTQWQHITFSYDRSAGKAYFFVNGVADRAAGLSISGTALSTGHMIIGRHRNNGEGPFHGLIDEVRVYNKALTAEEAAAVYAYAPAGAPDPEPVPPADAVTLTVDVNDPQRIIESSSIFGINHRYAFNGYGSFDSETMQVKEDFKALYEDAGFGSIRYPGGTISNLFNWKTTIGPVADRKKQIHGFYNNPGQGGIAPNFGLTEIATFAEDVESEIVYVYSLGRGNAQDAADLIEYLNAKVGTNPNGGIDWAAVRAANGHEAPYNVRYFEIGNEMQQAWGGSDGTASQGYWTTNVSAGAETAYIDGGTAVFNQQYAVCEEDWNAQASRSTGEPGMVRYMRYANVNPMKYDDQGNVVIDPDFKAVNNGVSVYVGGTQWTVVQSFAGSGASDKHCVVDYSTGAIRFGDGVKGAIPTAGQQITVSYSVDRQGFIDVSKAIKNTIAKINEIEGTDYEAHVYSSFETAGFISKMAQRGANEWYDGLTIHPYSGTPSGSGDSFYDSAMALAENVGIHKVQEYVDMMPSDKVPVISEYGIFRSTDPLVRSQTHAIYIAKVLMEYVRLGSPYIQKHCLIDWYSSGADSLGPTQQAVIQAVPGSDANTVTGEGTFTFFSTPSAHVFKMLNSAFADTVVATEFDRTPTLGNGAQALSALASVDENSNIYVAIVNASREEDYPIALNLEGISAEGATVTAQLLTADSYAAQNSPENPNAVSVQELTLSGEWTQTIPRHSFVILKIDPAAELDSSTVVGSFTVDPAELPTKGGEATVTITGRNLPDGITVKCGEQTFATSGSSIKQTAKLTFPANTGKEDIVYDIQYSLDGVTFEGDLSVTVFVNRYDPDDASRDIDPNSMTVYAENFQPDNATEGDPRYALDGNPSTFWHTVWRDSERSTHYMIFTFPDLTTINGMRFLQRSGSINGVVTKFDLLVRENESDEWTTVVDDGTLATDAAWQLVSFDAVKARQVKFQVVDATSGEVGNKFAAAAEVRFTKANEAPHEHSYTAVVTAPTCTTGGYTTYTCECGDSYQADETAALGHEWKGTGCIRCDATRNNPFVDVKENDYFIDPVLWAVEKGITNGMDATHFGPNVNVTRAQVVTFLWAAADRPEPVSTENPFVDVAKTDYFYKAVLWASENGITSGMDASHFAPGNACTREQVVTFLYAAVGKPATSATVSFSDVASGAWYHAPVAWALENGITSGLGDGTFGVGATCTRAQIVTFLYRSHSE